MADFPSFLDSLPPVREPRIVARSGVVAPSDCIAIGKYLIDSSTIPDAGIVAARGAIVTGYLSNFLAWRGPFMWISEQPTYEEIGRAAMSVVPCARSWAVGTVLHCAPHYIVKAGIAYRHAPLTFRRLLKGEIGVTEADTIARQVRQGFREDSADPKVIVPVPVADSPVILYEASLRLLRSMKDRIPMSVFIAHERAIDGLIANWKNQIEEAG